MREKREEGAENVGKKRERQRHIGKRSGKRIREKKERVRQEDIWRE